jgi:hypothetical protein
LVTLSGVFVASLADGCAVGVWLGETVGVGVVLLLGLGLVTGGVETDLCGGLCVPPLAARLASSAPDSAQATSARTDMPATSAMNRRRQYVAAGSDGG